MTISKAMAAVLFTSALATGGPAGPSGNAAPIKDTGLSGENLLQLQMRIKPQPGESRWLEIPWFLDVHAARQKAAAEGKPLFIYSGGGATGIGPC